MTTTKETGRVLANCAACGAPIIRTTIRPSMKEHPVEPGEQTPREPVEFIGLIALPESAASPAFVVGWHTCLSDLEGVTLHHSHVPHCQPPQRRRRAGVR